MSMGRRGGRVVLLDASDRDRASIRTQSVHAEVRLIGRCHLRIDVHGGIECGVAVVVTRHGQFASVDLVTQLVAERYRAGRIGRR